MTNLMAVADDPMNSPQGFDGFANAYHRVSDIPDPSGTIYIGEVSTNSFSA